MNFHLRFTFAFFLLGSTGLLLQGHSNSEAIAPRTPLAQMPSQFGAWTGTDFTIPKDELQVLGAGDFLSRRYRDQGEAGIPPVDLFMAYFPSQRFGGTIHSPKHCLPGSGWQPAESRTITLTLPGNKPFPVNRYVIVKGDQRQLVLYWYWAHDRGVASEYWAKFYLLADSIRMNRSDGSLVRVNTTIRAGETSDMAEQRLLSFAANIIPTMNAYVPR
jgi:EpsI family protein